MQNFRRAMIQHGVLSYREHETLFQIGMRCAKTTGIPLGGAGAVLGISAGSVAIPGIGSVPGAVAGFLAGMATGTMACTVANYGMRDQLRALLDE